MIKAALNGGPTKAEHECVPTSPSEIAHAAHDAVEAGAAAVHIHVRDTAGAESLHADDVAQTLNAVREVCPGIPVGISTGAWIVPDLAERRETIGTWTILPDFVSLNFHEQGTPAILDVLLEQGIRVEAGLSTVAAARQFVDCRRAADCLRVLIEPDEQTREDAVHTTTEIETMLDVSDLSLPRLLHGEGAVTWPADSTRG